MCHAWHNMQSCAELAGEAVDYIERPAAHDSQPAVVVILAVDTTPDAADLEAVKTALIEVLHLQSSFLQEG